MAYQIIRWRCEVCHLLHATEAFAAFCEEMDRLEAAQGIEARQGGDGTAPREARKPDPKGCAHD